MVMTRASLLGLAALGMVSTLAGISRAAENTAVRRTGATQPVWVRPAVNHSAPYTRLIGPATSKAPVRLAEVQAQAAASTRIPAQNVGWHHAYRPYAAGYGGYIGSPYGGFYGAYPAWGGAYGVPMAPFAGGYAPYAYSYRPWVGGYSGYPYYTAYNPGFGGYYAPAYYGGAGVYGGYGARGFGGCCYW